MDIFRSLRSTWMSLTLTHGESRRKSAGFWLIQIITWWSRDDHVTTNAEAVKSLATNHQVRFCLRLKEQTSSSHAWRTEYNIKLAANADHRMWDQFSKQSFVYRFTDGMTASKKKKKSFGTWNPCFLLSVTTLALLFWFHNLRPVSGSYFWLLCATTLPSRFTSGGDPSPLHVYD